MKKERFVTLLQEKNPQKEWGMLSDRIDRTHCIVKLQLQPSQGGVKVPKKTSKQPEEKPHANHSIDVDLQLSHSVLVSFVLSFSLLSQLIK